MEINFFQLLVACSKSVNLNLKCDDEVFFHMISLAEIDYALIIGSFFH